MAWSLVGVAWVEERLPDRWEALITYEKDEPAGWQESFFVDFNHEPSSDELDTAAARVLAQLIAAEELEAARLAAQQEQQ